jgi:hypothetical protein
MTRPADADVEPAEHLRFARYLQELAQVPEMDEADLVALILRDPDTAMAQSAVVRHLDRRAAHLLFGPGFASWTKRMAEVIGRREFLVQRLREWTLLKSITLSEPWAIEELTSASNWLQLKVSETTTFPCPGGTR